MEESKIEHILLEKSPYLFKNLNSASIGEYVQPKFLIQIHHLLRNLGDHAMIL